MRRKRDMVLIVVVIAFTIVLLQILVYYNWPDMTALVGNTVLAVAAVVLLLVTWRYAESTEALVETTRTTHQELLIRESRIHAVENVFQPLWDECTKNLGIYLPKYKPLYKGEWDGMNKWDPSVEHYYYHQHVRNIVVNTRTPAMARHLSHSELLISRQFLYQVIYFIPHFFKLAGSSLAGLYLEPKREMRRIET